MEKFIRSADEKMKIWIENQHWKLDLNLQELMYIKENYSQYVNGLFNKVKLNITQSDIEKYSIEELSQIKSLVSTLNFSFDNITTLNFDILEQINSIYSNNDINDSIVRFHYREAYSYEKGIETLKQESLNFKQLVSGIDAKMSDLEKFIIIYQRLGKKINYGEANNGFSNEYDTNSNNNLEGIITNKSVCGGYTLILEQALSIVGIKVKSRTGGLMSEGLHAWNQVCIDGKWYNCDLTLDNTQIVNNQVPLQCLKSDNEFMRNGHRDTGSIYPNNLIYEEKSECIEDYDVEIIKRCFEEIYRTGKIDSLNTQQTATEEFKTEKNTNEMQMQNYMKTRIKNLTNIQISDNKGYVGNGDMVLKSKQELIEEKEQLEELIDDLLTNNRIDTNEKNRLINFIKEEYKNMILKAPDTNSNLLDYYDQMLNQLNQQNQQVNEKKEVVDIDLDSEYLIYYINSKCMNQVDLYRSNYDYDMLEDEQKEELDKKILEVLKVELDNDESYITRKKQILERVKENLGINSELHNIDIYDLIESFDTTEIIENIEGKKTR